MTQADKEFFIRLLSGVVALSTPHNKGEDWRETAEYAEKLLREHVENRATCAAADGAAGDLEPL
jgi:hypothetical protein